MITIKFDDTRVLENEILSLARGIKNIVSKVTGIKDVFVYADSPKIKIQVAPIEIFIEMSASKIEDSDSLMESIINLLLEWKKINNFVHPLNISLIPMNWKIKIGI